jgi:hypothetical protein
MITAHQTVSPEAKENVVASGQQAPSKSITHTVLGPAEAIYDDRTHSMGNLFLGLACICLGPLGVYWGSGDLASGNSLLGVAYVAGGLVLFLYAVRLTLLAVVRLRDRVALVVARDGFEATGGDGPVGWDEVRTVSDPASPPGEPRILRVQLIDPRGYVERHGVGPIGRWLLRYHQYDLFLGRDMALPVADVQARMRKRLAEFRSPHQAAWGDVGGRPTGPRGRRPTRKR